MYMALFPSSSRTPYERQQIANNSNNKQLKMINHVSKFVCECVYLLRWISVCVCVRARLVPEPQNHYKSKQFPHKNSSQLQIIKREFVCLKHIRPNICYSRGPHWPSMCCANAYVRERMNGDRLSRKIRNPYSSVLSLSFPLVGLSVGAMCVRFICIYKQLLLLLLFFFLHIRL